MKGTVTLKRTVTFCMELDTDQLQDLIAALEAAELWPEIVEELGCDLARLTASVRPGRRVVRPQILGKVPAGAPR